MVWVPFWVIEWLVSVQLSHPNQSTTLWVGSAHKSLGEEKPKSHKENSLKFFSWPYLKVDALSLTHLWAAWEAAGNEFVEPIPWTASAISTVMLVCPYGRLDKTAHVGPWHTQQPWSHTPADPTTEARTICSHAAPAGGPAVAHDARQGAAATAQRIKE